MDLGDFVIPSSCVVIVRLRILEYIALSGSLSTVLELWILRDDDALMKFLRSRVRSRILSFGLLDSISLVISSSEDNSSSSFSV